MWKQTPCIVIEKRILQRNIEEMQAKALAYSVKLRPHIKTHKCIEIAQMQLQAGACGLTCSKSEEAQVFLEQGYNCLVAYPLLEEEKVRNLLRFGDRVSFICDSQHGLDILKATEPIQKKTVFIKIDVGLHRCGVEPESSKLLDIARGIMDPSNSLVFGGIISHAGHAYGATTPDQIRKIADSERTQMLLAKKRLDENGLPCGYVSVGSTMTEAVRDCYDSIDEMRPGNYVFYDATALAKNLIKEDQIALTVYARVISKNDHYAIIDCGSKVLSSDTGAHGSQTDGGPSFGLCIPAHMPLEIKHASRVVKLSEEHGWVSDSHRFEIGQFVKIIPTHSCPVVNLADRLEVVDGEEHVATWKVAARGKTK